MEEDETIPDNEQDIRPRFHKSKIHNLDQRENSKDEDVSIVCGMICSQSSIETANSYRLFDCTH